VITRSGNGAETKNPIPPLKAFFDSYLAKLAERGAQGNRQGHRSRWATSTTPGSVSSWQAGGAGMPSRSVQ